MNTVNDSNELIRINELLSNIKSMSPLTEVLLEKTVMSFPHLHQGGGDIFLYPWELSVQLSDDNHCDIIVMHIPETTINFNKYGQSNAQILLSILTKLSVDLNLFLLLDECSEIRTNLERIYSFESPNLPSSSK